MEMLMSLQGYLRQVSPIQESQVNHLEKIQKLLSEKVAKLPQEKGLDVDTLVQAEESSVSTQMYEAAGVIVGMEGKNLTKSKLTNVMGHNQFSPIAKAWIEDFLKVHSNKEALDALLNWMVLIGGAVADVHSGVFKDFIHRTVDKEYKGKGKAPTTFQISAADKPNTADAIFITNGTRQDVFNAFSTIARLREKDQSSRVKTTKKGLITLLDEKGKEIVSYYQISLKKAFAKARVGRATAFINKNYLGGISSASVTDARGFVQRNSSYDHNQGEMVEGFFGDALSKFKDVVSGGFKNFAGWAKVKYTKITKVLIGLSVKLANQKIKRNRGMKSITNILKVAQLNESSLTSFLGEKKSPNIEVTKKLLTEFKTLSQFVKNDEINKLHKENMNLMSSLNAKFAVPGRKVLPILMLPNENAGLVDMVSIGNEIDKVIKSKLGDIITKADIYVALKVGMNYSANTAIFAILKSIERNELDYKNLSQALFAFSAEIESEVKFGNTSLPLVIVYGGEDKKAIVLGTRSDYKDEKTSELSTKGLEVNNFPVAIFSVDKAKAGKTKQLYNVIKIKMVSDFKEVGGKPEPIYLMFELIADQSRSFSFKIEGNKYEDKTKAMS